MKIQFLKTAVGFSVSIVIAIDVAIVIGKLGAYIQKKRCRRRRGSIGLRRFRFNLARKAPSPKLKTEATTVAAISVAVAIAVAIAIRKPGAYIRKQPDVTVIVEVLVRAVLD